MLKKILYICLLLMSFSVFASPKDCGDSLPITDPGFCGSFASVSACNCEEAGYTEDMCTDMHDLYSYMMQIYNGSLQEACADTTDPEGCVDKWNCYWEGGTDSRGEQCSGSGDRCEAPKM